MQPLRPGSVGPVPDQRESPDATEEHTTSLRERGSFVSAHCSCGWRGPARRARARAQADARAHDEA
ncbi:hypothetical protein HPT28_20225 [Streptomyces sp. JJ38]|nr:hypothetical protein [Streptomyces sp. JJ38]